MASVGVRQLYRKLILAPEGSINNELKASASSRFELKPLGRSIQNKSHTCI